MNLPPPSPPEEPTGSKHPPFKVIGIAAAILVGVGVLTAIGNRNDDDSDEDGGVKMTLTQAACNLLAEGNNPEDVYATMKILAADHPLTYGEDESLAARVATNTAVAQGCD